MFRYFQYLCPINVMFSAVAFVNDLNHKYYEKIYRAKT